MKPIRLLIFAFLVIGMIFSRNHRGKFRNENDNESETENYQMARGVMCNSVRCTFASHKYCCKQNSSENFYCSTTPCSSESS